MEQILSTSTISNCDTNIEVIPEAILSQVNKLNISGENCNTETSQSLERDEETSTNIPDIDSINNERLAVGLKDQDSKRDFVEDKTNSISNETDAKTINVPELEFGMNQKPTESRNVPKSTNEPIEAVTSKPESDKAENNCTNDELVCVNRQVKNLSEFDDPVSGFQAGCEPNDLILKATNPNKEIQINNMSSRVEAPKSSVILNRNSDSLRNLLVYDSDDSSTSGSLSDDSEDEVKEIGKNPTWSRLAPATKENGTSDSETDSTLGDTDDDEDDTDSSSSDSADDSVQLVNAMAPQNKLSKPEKPTKEEDLLPPVPDLSTLNINFEKEEFLHMGIIAAIVDKLVTVEALPGVPAYDLDSYLFIDQDGQKKPFGAIFDVLGPVTAPLYCVRFNSANDIQELKLQKGMKVFVAPKSKYSKYIFVSELMKFKGTDASWKDDQERPGDLEEFSDDEKEQEAKREQKRAQLKRRHGSLERHEEYERNMNLCNVLDTSITQLEDRRYKFIRNARPARPVNLPPRNLLQTPSYSATSASNAGTLPAFDPSVPPPGFSSHSPSVTAMSSPSLPVNQWNRTPPIRGAGRPPGLWQSNNQPSGFFGPPRGRAARLFHHMNSRFYPPGPSSNNF